MGATTAAPPDNSDITYVKIQPITNQDLPPTHARIRESRIENVPLTIRAYNIDNENNLTNKRHIRSDSDVSISDVSTTFLPIETEVTDTTEAATETIEIQSSEEKVDSVEYEVSKKPAPRRFYSKLSYFQKPNYGSALSTNLIDTRSSKRRYRSKCRCERIWNCPKLQISVPRCPEEYFMCCF